MYGRCWGSEQTAFLASSSEAVTKNSVDKKFCLGMARHLVVARLVGSTKV
jgi:hypothetical protein